MHLVDVLHHVGFEVEGDDAVQLARLDGGDLILGAAVADDADLLRVLAGRAEDVEAGHRRLGVAGHQPVAVGVRLERALDDRLRAGDIVGPATSSCTIVAPGAPSASAACEVSLISSSLIEPSPLPT